ncbi:MAG TPA: bifunctional salicylyl-CoA 5-hydroxylase/oxidoreductase [Nocardioidaceae bacterium]|nr:bifunctional salicylyl-CoA 5-hydroxylase/oxidoreductase [Nocardioidaceae bacterium]
MKIAVIGGGPGGLYFASLMMQLDPSNEITVWERNAPEDTFGFGVVFSDQTLSGIVASDRSVYEDMGKVFAYWDDVDVHIGGERFSVGGNGFAAMSRKDLLGVLQRRAKDFGVQVHYRTEAPPVDELMADHDLVVASDGINSAVRQRFAEEFGTSEDPRKMKYMWLGTDKVYDAFKFFIKETEWGVMQVHAYPMDDRSSTFIVEMDEDVWRQAGFDKVDAASLPPGVSDEDSIERIAEVWADVLDGGSLTANNSKWVTFRTIRNETLVHQNLVLLGDAAHTAHFSIGSGTKLAMEDALALAACLFENPTLEAALTAYDTERGPVVKSTQRSAQASMEWFEELRQYTHQDHVQFVFNLMTRSRRITYGNLKERDPEFMARVDDWFLADQVKQGRVPEATEPVPPMFLPFKIKDLTLRNRVVVSAMDMYSAVDGVPGDFHLVHLGSRAIGGAGLVMTEMVCVSPEGRITPGCGGLWNDEQQAAWQRIADFGHEYGAAMGLQIGHSGRKGSTKLMWEGIDQPLDEGNWPLVAPSPLPYLPHSQVPREMTRADMDEIKDQFVETARRGAEAGFDVLELHCAHGYLLSSFLTPVSNQRTDEYGGSLANRLRYPLEVFDAVRDAWPSNKPLFVRISATDWVPDGITDEESVQIAQAFTRHGADLIDVSTGQTTPESRPTYGRSYQTPYADRIRNRAGVATMAVGSISSWDDVNTIIAAGRSDLCALGRPHLYDPYWTLHAAAEQGVDRWWPAPYRAGRRMPPAGRAADPKPRLELVAPSDRGDLRPSRWRPHG